MVGAIDRATRTVTLLNAEGESRAVGVPPDMKSFDTLKVGDHVDVDYYRVDRRRVDAGRIEGEHERDHHRRPHG